MLHAAGEHRAVDDLRRMTSTRERRRRRDARRPSACALVGRAGWWSPTSSRPAAAAGFPATWLGVDVEAHGLPTGLASTLSFAVRWHGERPAVLWEINGAPMPLTHDDWSTAQLSGEALWLPVVAAWRRCR